jgi:hypothetical protein
MMTTTKIMTIGRGDAMAPFPAADIDVVGNDNIHTQKKKKIMLGWPHLQETGNRLSFGRFVDPAYYFAPSLEILALPPDQPRSDQPPS